MRPARLTIRRMEHAPHTSVLIHRGKRIEVTAGQTIRDAVRKAGLATEAVLAMREGELVTDDILLRAGDEIKLVAVISGG